jgi:CheY-like chemotaxis protein
MYPQTPDKQTQEYIELEKQTNIEELLVSYCKSLQNILDEYKYKWGWFNKNFLSNISHQLKTPLSGIFNGTQVLSSRIKNEDDKLILDCLFKSCFELSTYLSHIIDYYVFTQNKAEIELSLFTLSDIIASINKLFEEQFDTNNTKFKFKFVNCSLSSNIYSDKHKIIKVISNLMSNSLKFTFNGTILLVIQYRDLQGDYIFRLFDTGDGIPKDDREHIFDPFYQVQNNWITHQDGLGLGLTISKKITECLGGGIKLETVDKFSGLIDDLTVDYHNKSSVELDNSYTTVFEFWVPNNSASSKPIAIRNTHHNKYLSSSLQSSQLSPNNIPVNSPQLQSLSPQTNSVDVRTYTLNTPMDIRPYTPDISGPICRNPPSSPITILGSNTAANSDKSRTYRCKLKNRKRGGKDIMPPDILPNILIIDDNTNNVLILKHLIKSLGKYSVNTISNSLIATYEILNGSYDIIFLDLKMPKKSGFDILEDLNKAGYFKSNPDTNIIIITALIPADIKAKLSIYPNIEVLYKPVESDTLANVISKTLATIELDDDEDVFTD